MSTSRRSPSTFGRMTPLQPSAENDRAPAPTPFATPLRTLAGRSIDSQSWEQNVPRSTVLVDASTTRVRGSVKRHCKGLTGRMKAPSVASNASTRLRYQISPRASASGGRLLHLPLDSATLHGIGDLLLHIHERRQTQRRETWQPRV